MKSLFWCRGLLKKESVVMRDKEVVP